MYTLYPPGTKVRIKSTGQTGEAYEKSGKTISVWLDPDDKLVYLNTDDVEFIII